MITDFLRKKKNRHQNGSAQIVAGLASKGHQRTNLHGSYASFFIFIYFLDLQKDYLLVNQHFLMAYFEKKCRPHLDYLYNNFDVKKCSCSYYSILLLIMFNNLPFCVFCTVPCLFYKQHYRYNNPKLTNHNKLGNQLLGILLAYITNAFCKILVHTGYTRKHD